METKRPKRIRAGKYLYKGYEITAIYHEPDHCVWWEGVNLETNCADYHYLTLRQVIKHIDEDESKN